MRIVIFLIVLLAASLMLSHCGQRGGLTRPEQGQEQAGIGLVILPVA
ncbi:MAG: LPS translocon maturation chaperone LptM [Pseudohongiellaceae bacterium]